MTSRHTCNYPTRKEPTEVHSFPDLRPSETLKESQGRQNTTWIVDSEASLSSLGNTTQEGTSVNVHCFDQAFEEFPIDIDQHFVEADVNSGARAVSPKSTWDHSLFSDNSLCFPSSDLTLSPMDCRTYNLYSNYIQRQLTNPRRTLPR